MNQTNKNLTRNKKLTLTGALSALVIVLTLTNLGFISFSPVVSITILQIPVILAATLAGLPEGIFVGFIMGLMSLIKAAMSPTGILDPLFVYPWNSVLPRMLLGVVAWAVFKLLDLIPRMPKAINAAITGFVATFCHTLMVYGCIFLFDGAGMRTALESIGMAGVGYFGVVGVGIVSEMAEAASSLIVCAAVYAGLYFGSKKKSKLSKEMVLDAKDSEKSENID
ncbi:MAG: ECF transporter S component [Treponema sp.]|nr:ECF transporter S component [Treponema sp.]